jgi:D-alanine transaminase
MSRIDYVNGRYWPYREGMVSVEDRGYQFADAVYEVCEVRGGHLIDEPRHMARLVRSLSEIGIRPPMASASLGVVLREVVRRNRVVDGIVYLQIGRGVAPRSHVFPPDVAPSLVVTARSIDPAINDKRAADGVAVITVADDRWHRVDIKTTGLLPNVLAKQRAKEAGALEAWFVDAGGFVTEGGSTNAWIVTDDERLVTRPAISGILRGITRGVVHDLAAREGIPLDERPFTVAEALAANEAFITSAGVQVMPVVRIDGTPIASGKPGRISLMLRRLYHSQAEIAPTWSRGLAR